MTLFECYAKAVVRNFSLTGDRWSSAELNHRIALFPPADYWIIKQKMQSEDLPIIGPEGSLSHYMNVSFFQYLAEENDFLPMPALIEVRRLQNLSEWREYEELESVLSRIGLQPFLSFRKATANINGVDVFAGDVRVMFCKDACL